MKIKIALFLFVFGLHPLWSQIDVFEDEIVLKDGIVYYQNFPLTGTVYSDDDEPVPNTCQCTKVTRYKDGLLHGISQEWYTDGKLKFQGNYLSGKPQGTHIYYYPNGKPSVKIEFENGTPVKKELYYETGELKSVIPFVEGREEGTEKVYATNGQLLQENEYHAGLLQKTRVYKDNRLVEEKIYTPTHRKEIYYKDDGKIEFSYLRSKNILDGETIKYDKQNNVLERNLYKNDKLIKTQSFKNNRKHGKFFSLSDDLKRKTVEIYNNGDLVKKYTIDAGHFLENYELLPQDNIYKYHNKFTGLDEYFIIRFTSGAGASERVNAIKKRILEKLNLRGTPVSKDDIKGEKQLKNIVRISNIQVQYKKIKHEDKDKKIDYEIEAEIQYTVNIFDADENPVKSFTSFFDSRQSLGAEILSQALKVYPRTRERAFEKALKNIFPQGIYACIFPVRTQIKSIIKQTDSKIKTVEIDAGSKDNVYKKMYLSVYDPSTGSLITSIKLKVIKLQYATSECKVVKGQNTLKEVYQNRQNVFVKETLK